MHKQVLESINKNDFICQIDDASINANKILHINEFTKCKDLLNFTKNNPFLNYVSEITNFLKMVDFKALENEMELLNNKMQMDYFEFNHDSNKILQTIFLLNGDIFLSSSSFIQFLELNKTNSEKITIFISQTCWLKIKEIYQYLNFYNFIIFTNDFRYVLEKFDVSTLDSVLVNFNNQTFTDFVDLNIVSNYVADCLKTPLSYKQLIDFFISNLVFDEEKIEQIAKIIKKI
jgi:hypothetical protein